MHGCHVRVTQRSLPQFQTARGDLLEIISKETDYHNVISNSFKNMAVKVLLTETKASPATVHPSISCTAPLLPLQLMNQNPD